MSQGWFHAGSNPRKIDPLFVAVNNIPTPYRVHLFEALAAEFADRGVRFQAWFMARTEEGRHWDLQSQNWRMCHRFFPGMHPRVGRLSMHWNPTMLAAVARLRPQWMLLGGSWLTPTTAMLNLAAPTIGRGTRVLLWSEANYASTTSTSRLVAVARKLLYEHGTACVIPGRIAYETIRDVWGLERPRLIRLPNIVDERVYLRGSTGDCSGREGIRRQFGILPCDTMLLLLARLHEESKGILNFLKAVRPLLDSSLKVVIAGEGPDRSVVEAWIEREQVTTVRLLGHVDQDEVVRLLIASDGLVMPSFRDPNPLAVIEGLWSGLPLMISRNCGNWPEALDEGVNGWLLDPANLSNVRQIVTEFMDMAPERRSEMGAASRAIAGKRFATARVVSTFVDDVLDLR